MKFTVEQADIVKEVGALTTYVLGNNAFMQQDNVKFEAIGKNIRVSSYNGENSILFELNGTVEEDGEVIVPGKVLSSLVQNLQTGLLTFSFDELDGQLMVTGDGVSYNFPSIDSNDWQDVKYPDFDKFQMPSKTFVKNINKVTKAAAQRDNQRPILEGTLFVVDQEDIVLASTDGFRICVRGFKHNATGAISDYGCIVHSKTLDILSKLIKLECTENVEVKIAFDKGKRIFLEIEDKFLIVAPILGEKEKFPDWKRFLPNEIAVDVIVDKKEFIESHKRCSLFIENKFREPVVLTFNATGNINLHVGPTVAGEANEDLQATEIKLFNSDAPHKTGLNTSFLGDGVSIIDHKTMRFRTSPESGKQVFMICEANEDVSNPKNFYIVVPLRLK